LAEWQAYVLGLDQHGMGGADRYLCEISVQGNLDGLQHLGELKWTIQIFRL